MSGYTVEPGELFGAEARVVAAADDGRVELDRLRAAGADLFAGGWSGRAASAFRGGFDEWVAGATQLLAALDELGAALGACARDYATAEGTNTAGFLRLAS